MPIRLWSQPGLSRCRTCRVAEKLGDDVFHAHAVGYRRPDEVPTGTVMVVGGGNTGFQIAKELSGTHNVVLSVGSHQKPLPQRVLGRDLFWWLTKTRIFNTTVESRLGRKLSTRDTLIGSSPRELDEALRRRAQTAARRRRSAGAPASRTAASSRSILSIWATGYRRDYSWIKLPIFDDNGSPAPPSRCHGCVWAVLPGVDLAAHPRIGVNRLGQRRRRVHRRQDRRGIR